MVEWCRKPSKSYFIWDHVELQSVRSDLHRICACDAIKIPYIRLGLLTWELQLPQERYLSWVPPLISSLTNLYKPQGKWKIHVIFLYLWNLRILTSKASSRTPYMWSLTFWMFSTVSAGVKLSFDCLNCRKYCSFF